ncbi:hypothetical protein FGO68_gene17583 [Halteria grandinella]|uniref:Uncharacterized protein n=1 Tax=Halteria grandinella TaxID=5974 RepID=A0A8J8NZJ6_HALGN|nr:hypothetical protein FGO68_gene17583 [Halteria grandinella]
MQSDPSILLSTLDLQAEYASPKDFLASFLPGDTYAFHLEIFNTLRFTHARRLSARRNPVDKNTTDIKYAIHRAVVYALLEHYFAKQRSWEDYFSGICPLVLEQLDNIASFTELDDIITTSARPGQADSGATDYLLNIDQISVKQLIDICYTAEAFETQQKKRECIKRISQVLQKDVILFVMKDQQFKIIDSLAEGIQTQHILWILIDETTNRNQQNGNVYIVFPEEQILQCSKNIRETICINWDILKENLIRLSVTSMSLNVLQKLRQYNFPMYYADPVYSRVRILLELNNDQANEAKKDMMTKLMNDPARASSKFKKFQSSFLLQYDGNDWCLYRKANSMSDHTYMVLIPTIEEEVELLVKCHREEFHEDGMMRNQNTELSMSFMRDMLTNNCHITNLVKKLDYVSSVCKQCRNGISEDRKPPIYHEDNPEQEIEDTSIDLDDYELPGKDLTIEMINLRRHSSFIPVDFEVVFIMDNFSSFFTLYTFDGVLGFWGPKTPKPHTFDEKIVKKGKYYIFNRVFTANKPIPGGRYHLRVEQMNQCMSKAFADNQIGYKIGTSDYFDAKVTNFLCHIESIYKRAMGQSYQIDLKQEILEMISRHNQSFDPRIQMTPIEAYYQQYAESEAIKHFTKEQLIEFVNQRKLELLYYGGVNIARRGREVEIDYQNCKHGIEFKNANTIVLSKERDMVRSDFQGLRGGRVVSSVCAGKLVQLKVYGDIPQYSARIPWNICKPSNSMALQAQLNYTQENKILKFQDMQNGLIRVKSDTCEQYQ